MSIFAWEYILYQGLQFRTKNMTFTMVKHIRVINNYDKEMSFMSKYTYLFMTIWQLPVTMKQVQELLEILKWMNDSHSHRLVWTHGEGAILKRKDYNDIYLGTPWMYMHMFSDSQDNRSITFKIDWTRVPYMLCSLWNI